jgi:hypothetical protein
MPEALGEHRLEQATNQLAYRHDPGLTGDPAARLAEHTERTRDDDLER